MARGIYLLFAGIAYCIFLATFLYLIAFLANVPGVPRTIDVGPQIWGWQALAVDSGLILLFGLQHSVMARRGFKAWWTRIVPEPIERSIYVLVTSLILILMFLFWRPIPVKIWHVDGTAAIILWALFGLGWAVVLLSTFLINHFELFGLAQTWRHLRSVVAVAPVLTQPFFYRLVRHPLYSGFFLAFWATPWMTLGHLVFALGMSIYMLVAIPFEERDLVATFGEDYEAYRGTTGKLIPKLKK